MNFESRELFIHLERMKSLRSYFASFCLLLIPVSQTLIVSVKTAWKAQLSAGDTIEQIVTAVYITVMLASVPAAASLA